MTHQIRAIIIDDERPARKGLIIVASEYPSIEIVGEADTIQTAVELILAKKPDLIFLDIQMPGESGFDLFNKIEINCKVVFVTAYDQFAIRAFEVNALDYLLKPVSYERFKLTMQRFFKDQVPKPIKSDYQLNDFIYIPVSNGYKFIQIQSIKVIKAQGDYTSVFTLDSGKKSVLASKTLSYWEKILPKEYFLRIHRSTLINLNFIKRIEKGTSHTSLVYIDSFDHPLQMSQRITSQFRKIYSL